MNPKDAQRYPKPPRIREVVATGGAVDAVDELAVTVSFVPEGEPETARHTVTVGFDVDGTTAVLQDVVDDHPDAASDVAWADQIQAVMVATAAVQGHPAVQATAGIRARMESARTYVEHCASEHDDEWVDVDGDALEVLEGVA